MIAAIQSVVLSSRYVEGLAFPSGPYMRSDDGLRFGQLRRADQRELLTNAPFCPDFREFEHEASKTSLAGLKQLAIERTKQAEHRNSRDQELEREARQ